MIADGLGREESCSDECKLLTNRNYIELMWTSFAEMPGECILWISTSIFMEDIVERSCSAANYGSGSVIITIYTSVYIFPEFRPDAINFFNSTF